MPVRFKRFLDLAGFSHPAPHECGESWAGGQKFVATGMILSFKSEAGMEGQLDSVSRTVIEIEFKNNFDEFTAVISQDYWFCPDSFSCPDPLNAPPDLTVPAEGSGFSILARRLKPM